MTGKYDSATVSCYSGRSYADRPVSFVWRNERYEIESVEREWLEPAGKHFIVYATKAGGMEGEKRFEICYYTREDSWQLREV